MLQFTRAIRKSASSMLSSAASQPILLIKGRSLHDFLCTDSHASMESAHKKPRVNCNVDT